MTEENETVSFRKDERMRYGVLGYDGNEMMAAITGYDLDVSFNMRLINSLADAEACADALADVLLSSTEGPTYLPETRYSKRTGGGCDQ